MLLITLLLLADPAPSPAKSPPPATLKATTTSVAPAPAGTIATADDLLLALERAGADIRTLSADMRWTRQYGELEGGDKTERRGRLIFESDQPAAPNAPARRRFQVDFTSTQISDARHIENETFIFDGEWFVERHPERKQVIRRRVVAPGEVIDPLAIGEGPFPIPIGQKRDRILERFEATLLPPGDGFADNAAPPALNQTYQLRLVPRRGTDEARQFQEVRIWYRQSDLLPRLARTRDKDDSSTEVFLVDMKLNQPLPSGAFDATTPAGWDEDVREFRRAQADE